MTVGEKFILACSRHRDVKSFLDAPDKFFSEEEFILYDFCRKYLYTHSELPSTKLLKDAFPHVERIEGSVSYHFQNLKSVFVKSSITEALPTLASLLKKDSSSAVSKLRELLSLVDFSGTESRDLILAEKVSDRYRDYVDRTLTSGITYLPYGDSFLDEWFSGIGQTDLITVGAKPGVGKTFLAIHVSKCVSDWMIFQETYEDVILPPALTMSDLGRPILFISNEMNEVEIAERFDCIYFKLPYPDYVKGRLTRAEKYRYEKGVMKSKIVILYNVSTLNDLRAKMKIYNPVLVVVDGSYLLEPLMKEGYDKTVFITRNLKNIAKEFRIPIFNTTQLRKSGGKGEVTMSDAQDDFYHGSYIQDSDVALRGYQDADMAYYQTVLFTVAKGRRISPNARIMWERNLNTMDFKFYNDDDETDEFEDFIP